MDPERYESLREINMASKQSALTIAMAELNGIINKSQFARDYFGKSQGWLSQRLHGNLVFDKAATFKPEEYRQFTDGMRDLAKRLATLADEIDAAPII